VSIDLPPAGKASFIAPPSESRQVYRNAERRKQTA